MKFSLRQNQLLFSLIALFGLAVIAPKAVNAAEQCQLNEGHISIELPDGKKETSCEVTSKLHIYGLIDAPVEDHFYWRDRFAWKVPKDGVYELGLHITVEKIVGPLVFAVAGPGAVDYGKDGVWPRETWNAGLSDLVAGITPSYVLLCGSDHLLGDFSWEYQDVVTTSPTSITTQTKCEMQPSAFNPVGYRLMVDEGHGDNNAVFFELKYMMVVRRVEDGCWVAGQVRGSNLSGDYAFWSNNPTGIQINEEQSLMGTTEDAQSSIESIANMDTDLLATMGIDPNQLQQAQNAAINLQASEELLSPSGSLPTLAEELSEFEGKIFLTLQSVKGDDDLTLVGGSSAGIAGDLSLADLAQGMAHILSKFSLNLELNIDQDALEPEELALDFGKNVPINRAGLVYNGLKYTWPGEGGPTPTLKLKECPSEEAKLGAICGDFKWDSVADLEFQAGPGAFSCINN